MEGVWQWSRITRRRHFRDAEMDITSTRCGVAAVASVISLAPTRGSVRCRRARAALLLLLLVGSLLGFCPGGPPGGLEKRSPPGGARARGRCSYPSPAIGHICPSLAGKVVGNIPVGPTPGCALTRAHLCHRPPNWALFGRSASVGLCCCLWGRCLLLPLRVVRPLVPGVGLLSVGLWPSAFGLSSGVSCLDGRCISLSIPSRQLRCGAWALFQGSLLLLLNWHPRPLGAPEHPLVVVAQIESRAL